MTASDPLHPSPAFMLADRLVEQMAAQSPITATYMGVAGHDHRLDDYGPQEAERKQQRLVEQLAEVRSVPVLSDDDRVAVAIMVERLEADLEWHRTGEHLRDINVLGSPVQMIRNVFTLMPTDTDEQWGVIADRLSQVPASLASVRATYAEGIAQDRAPARRQVLGVVRVAEICAGITEDASGVPGRSAAGGWFQGFIGGYTGSARHTTGTGCPIALHTVEAARAV